MQSIGSLFLNGKHTRIILIVLSGLLLLPFLWLGFFNHPSAIDDYCYIDTALKYGWLGAMKLYYEGWTGRFTGIFLNHTNPLLFGSFFGFKVLSWAMIIGLFLSMLFFFRLLAPAGGLWHWYLSLSIFFLYVIDMPSLAEEFYWMASFVTFTIPTILTLVWLIVLIIAPKTKRISVKRLLISISILLNVLIVGSSETNFLILFLLIGSWLFYALIFKQKIGHLFYFQLVALLIAGFFLLSAPGNQVRMGTNPQGGDILFSAKMSLELFSELLYRWLTTTPLLVFSAFFTVLILSDQSGYWRLPTIRPWFMILVIFGLVIAQLFPSYFGVGITPPPRVINTAYFSFLVGWFILLIYFVVKLKNASTVFTTPRAAVTVLLIAIAVVLMSVSSVYRSNNARLVYQDLVYNKARRYDEAMKKRYRTITTSKSRVVYVDELRDLPQTLFVGDLSSDVYSSQFLWNRCMAGYFGKDSILVKSKVYPIK